MSIFRKFMDSKFMDAVEVIGDTTVDIIKGMAEVTVEVATELFSGEISSTSTSNNNSMEERTRQYWESLDYREQEEYFKNNEYLRDYMNTHHYNDRHQTAKHVAELSSKLNREFTNKYDRY